MKLSDDLEIELGGIQGPSGKTVRIAVLRRSAQKALSGFPDLLEPAVQDAVLRLHSLPTPSAIENPVAYGAWVAHNTAVNLRSQELRQRGIQSELKKGGVRVVNHGHDSHVRHDLFKKFLAALESTPLGQRRRRVLTMTLQGFSAAEIASGLEVSPRTVYNDLKDIKEIIENLDPTDPDPPPNGGGKSGLPRGDPVAGLAKAGAWPVAPLSTLEIELVKENNRYEAASVGNQKGRRAAMVERRQVQAKRRANTHEAADADRSELVAIRDLRRLLLQLPAFRDTGLSSHWADDDGDPPRNLEEVFDLLVDGGPKRHPR